MCRDIIEALLEDVIEITWMLDHLINLGTLSNWDDIIDDFGSSGIKSEIIRIARDFEKKFPFETSWEDTGLDYIIEIEKFAKEKLIEVFGKED